MMTCVATFTKVFSVPAAVPVTVMFETWPDDSAPNYSVQTTHLKKGTVDHAAKAWSTYGGRVGVWRLMRTLERLGIPATFFVNARCTEVYPDAVKQIAHDGSTTCRAIQAIKPDSPAATSTTSRATSVHSRLPSCRSERD